MGALVTDWDSGSSMVERTARLGGIRGSLAGEMGDARGAAVRNSPQAVLNHQLVQKSDMLVGMFWTKLGTGTGVAESGTVEEIDQFVSAARPKGCFLFLTAD